MRKLLNEDCNVWLRRVGFERGVQDMAAAAAAAAATAATAAATVPDEPRDVYLRSVMSPKLCTSVRFVK